MDAPSPNAQMVLPMMPLPIWWIWSTSSIEAVPSSSFVTMRSIQPVPSRQGVHCPHDS